MKLRLWLITKELRHRKGRATVLCLTAALAEAGLYALFTLCAGFYRLFAEQAVLSGKEPAALAVEGLGDVFGMLLAFMFTFWYGDLGDVKVRAWDILSGEAALKNLPAFILLTGFVALITVFCAVDLVFSVYRREDFHFLNAMLVGGADEAFVKRYAVTEAFFVWAAGAPAALLLGAAETAVMRSVASISLGGKIGLSLHSNPAFALAAGIIVLLRVLLGFRKTSGGISVRHAAQGTREKIGAKMGVSAFSGEPVYYKILGLPHYIAMRNIEDRLERYLKIFFMTSLYLSTVGCLLLLLTFIRNYSAETASLPPAGECFLAANEFYFCASAALTQLIATAGTVCGVISHIYSNSPEYAQLRAAGASMRVIRRTARREGALCVAISFAVAAFWILLLSILFIRVYDPNLTGRFLSFNGIGRPLLALGSFALLYAATVSASVLLACRRVDRLDILEELKELAYS